MQIRGHDLNELEVEHDFIHPDDLPGYWLAKRDEPGMTTREYAQRLEEVAA